MNVSEEFAKKGIGIMFLFALGNAVWHEWGDPNNPSKPWPRPSKLIVTDLGFVGLYIMAAFLPSVAFYVTAGIVVGELLTDQGLLNEINSTFATARANSQAAG